MTELNLKTDIFFGHGTEEKAPLVLKNNGYKRVLLHYGSSSHSLPLVKKIEEGLKKEGIKTYHLPGVVPNPRISLVREGVKIVKDNNVDIVLAIGGGSVIDSAKAICYGAMVDFDVWDFYMGKEKPSSSLPLAVILTLSATGSECSDSSVLSNDEGVGYKRGVNSDLCRPKYAFLNPELTYSVSPYQTAAGSIDIMMHTLERYFHKGETLTLTDELSITLLKSVMKNAPIALKNPTNYDARAALMWAGTISHNGMMNMGNENRGDWSCHQIEHELSASFDVSHGAGLSVVWPHWARYVSAINDERFITLSRALFDSDDVNELIKRMSSFFKSLNMPLTLKELGINADDNKLKEIARNTTFDGKRTIGSYLVLKEDDIFNILRLCNE